MELKINFLDAGYCSHPECITLKGGRFQTKKYPSMFMHIEHPTHGHILYDTGYSERFHHETKNFPNKLYALLTPVFVNDKDIAISKLKEMGVEKDDVKYIIISHFHADHISAIADFPNAKYIYLKDDYDKVKGLKGIRGLLNGFLPGLLPKDFEQRSIQIDDKYKMTKMDHKIGDYFKYTYDIFGDGSLVAVDLPGHTSAQLGLYMRTKTKDFFLVADSCWHSKSIRDNTRPSLLTNLIHHNSKNLYQTLESLHKLYLEDQSLEQIPSHCGEVFHKYVEFCHWNKKNVNGVKDD